MNIALKEEKPAMVSSSCKKRLACSVNPRRFARNFYIHYMFFRVV